MAAAPSRRCPTCRLSCRCRRSSSTAARARGAVVLLGRGDRLRRRERVSSTAQAAKAHKDAERDFVIRIETEERPYHLAAASGDDMSNWLLALRGHCGE